MVSHIRVEPLGKKRSWIGGVISSKKKLKMLGKTDIIKNLK